MAESLLDSHLMRTSWAEQHWRQRPNSALIFLTDVQAMHTD